MHDAENRHAPPRIQVWRMFDRIAHRYDLLNRLLSFGTDTRWRRRMLRHLPPGNGIWALDLATGTGDVLICLMKGAPGIARGVGADMSLGMLEIGQRKLAAQGLIPQCGMVRADATSLGVASSRFDVVTIAFGIRNVISVEAALREMLRVLRPGGRALILEFSLPSNWFIRTGYLFYFRHILPRLGALISGDAHAYRYLNETVETFPYGEQFRQLMSSSGFQDIVAIPLTFGIATLYVGHKAAAP